MALKVYKFLTAIEAEYFLRGAVTCGIDISKAGVVGLVGQQISFTNPNFNHTFVTASRPNDALLFLDIKSQLEGASASIRVHQYNGRVVFIETTPTSGIQIPATNQLAKGLLGLDQNTAVAGKVYGVAAGTPPALFQSSIGTDGIIMLITNE